ncbi:Carbohydrate kinase, FGGY() [Methylophaga frappieri]|uniref:Carbohydrate kinase, FGGY() n=1 Tax=Methylophaga frappieri (strain ATCC BAA-2434 / DSM 25690 / JAM7) TaxID=754477 RepID=I1YE86_METFJ|nr:FGGY-family carbohydrate kinase [Methylophaga frappieri]AFJ01229.1 Carbohydrate kinase, FGGY() [Methylophaga frappieri]
MSTPVWLGIDLGTSGCRICVIDDENKLVFQRQQTFSSHVPYPDPPQQWQIVLTLLRQTSQSADKENWQIRAIAIAATSGTVMRGRPDGQPDSPMLRYDNAVAIDQVNEIKAIAPKHSGAHGIGSGLAKYLYLNQHYSSDKPGLLMHQADWIATQLGGQAGITDYHNALKSGFDPVALCWPDWLSRWMPATALPRVVAPGSMIGSLSDTVAQHIQLKQDIRPAIVAGTTDSLAAFLATGANQCGDGVTSLGSTLVVKQLCNQPYFEPESGIYSHKMGRYWLVGGASNSGSAVISQFFTDPQIKQLSEHINLAQQPPWYYPLLTMGERFPVADPDKQPQLTPRPEQDSLFLHGLLAGIANIEAIAYQRLQQLTATPLQRIRTVGGGAANAIWSKIRQQKLAVPFIAVAHTEAAYGCALLAKEGLSSFEREQDD